LLGSSRYSRYSRTAPSASIGSVLDIGATVARRGGPR
jgi:hypothetical protein